MCNTRTRTYVHMYVVIRIRNLDMRKPRTPSQVARQQDDRRSMVEAWSTRAEGIFLLFGVQTTTNNTRNRVRYTGGMNTRKPNATQTNPRGTHILPSSGWRALPSPWTSAPGGCCADSSQPQALPLCGLKQESKRAATLFSVLLLLSPLLPPKLHREKFRLLPISSKHEKIHKVHWEPRVNSDVSLLVGVLEMRMHPPRRDRHLDREIGVRLQRAFYVGDNSQVKSHANSRETHEKLNLNQTLNQNITRGNPCPTLRGVT